MILYRTLRQLARIALGWYYADVEIEGLERMPSSGSVLLVANHPNALVDAMAVAVAVPRRVLLTAKATLFERPMLAALLRTVGVVPLRRTRDEHGTGNSAPAATVRNADAFRMVTSALAADGVVLVFPEGISHDAPSLAPLKTGAARMALMAHDAGVHAVRIVAVGLIYEAKEQPRSRLLVRIGDALDLDVWLATSGGDASALTAEIDQRLRRVTLNFGSEPRARRAARLGRTLAAATAEVSPLDRPRSLAPEAEFAHRVDRATEALAAAPPSVVRQADEFIDDAEAFERRLDARGVALSELRVSPRVRHGAWFLLRELSLLALAFPVALLDRLAHDAPVRLARTITRRSLITDPSRDQPAMRTIVLAAAALLVWYLVLGIAIDRWLGPGAALLVLAVLVLSASSELALRDRLTRAWRRARTFLVLRADPAFRSSAVAEADRLLGRARRLERALLSEGPLPPEPRSVA